MLAPEAGAVKVTRRPTRGLPFAPRTRAESLCLNAVEITVDWGVPPVAVIVGPAAALAASTGTRRSTQAAAPLLRVNDASFI
jgi:hypothetical protein